MHHRILDLSACRGISTSSLQSALPQLKQLEVLHLDGNPEVLPLAVHPCLMCHCMTRLLIASVAVELP